MAEIKTEAAGENDQDPGGYFHEEAGLTLARTSLERAAVGHFH